MFGDFVQLSQSSSQFFKLVDLLVSELFSFDVLFFKLGQLFGQERKPVSRFLDLLEYIRLTLFNDVVKFLLTLELIDFELPFQFFLLFDLLLSCLEVTFQIEQEVGLLHKFETFLQLVVLFHQVDNGLVSDLDFTFGNSATNTDSH